MTNPSYTDEQVLAVVAQCLSRQIGAYEARVVRSLLADRQRLQADADRIDWLEKHTCGASDSERYLPFRIYWGRGDSRGIRKIIDDARATPNETKEAKS